MLEEDCLDKEVDMEAGCADGPISWLARAAPPPGQERQLRVHRRPAARTCVLLDEDKHPLFIARRSADGRLFEIFAGASRIAQASRPSFTLETTSAPAGSEMCGLPSLPGSEMCGWVLSATQCEGCEARGRRHCGKAPLARFVQYVQPIGRSTAYCMDVLVATVDGHCTGLCDSCRANRPISWRRTLTSRRPKWSENASILSLDFRGRASMASAKNFQLQTMENAQKKSWDFLYGKVAEQEFALEFRAPMSPLQAFAAAMSVSHWQ